MPVNLACPDCALPLTAVESGSVTAHRCPRCRGIWLDPDAFRRVCEEESRPPDEDASLAPARPPATPRSRRAAEPRVRYRPCAACREVMNRSNFARVSGVIIDVCRPHGAWFDRGELAAIRRFLRAGGLARYERVRRLDGEPARASPVPLSAPPVPGGSTDEVLDVLDVLVGGSSGWDVPRPPGLLVAGVLAVVGGGFLWFALHPHGSGSRWGLRPALIGAVCLILAGRELWRWRGRGEAAPVAQRGPSARG